MTIAAWSIERESPIDGGNHYGVMQSPWLPNAAVVSCWGDVSEIVAVDRDGREWVASGVVTGVESHPLFGVAITARVCSLRIHRA